jgi:cysteine synthase A
MQVNEKVLERTVKLLRERRIVVPTFAQMRDPSTAPQKIKDRLKQVGLWDVDPANLFRITWKNEPKEQGGLYNSGNWIEFPSALTGVSARVVGMVGKWFPTGAHKVGAAFGCLVPKLVSGQFDPTTQKAVWPSTGNFCRGGAFDCALLGCQAVGILPEEMSRERFDWLKEIGAEVIATPGCESNVKEIFDKCWEIRRTRPDCVIFNQFEEFGNSTWHYHTTGKTIDEIFRRIARLGDRLSGYASATGSGGTIAAGDFLRTVHPQIKVTAVEALQCPTLLMNGYGGHRIEGIGDKHVPWVHNVRNTDAVVAIDDEQCLQVMRLMNEPAGREFLAGEGIEKSLIEQLPLVGISGVCNLVAAIKTAKHFEFGTNDVVFCCLTDSMQLYGSRLEEERARCGPYDRATAARCFGRYLEAITDDHFRELTFPDRKAIHNLKYFTWVEQQQRSVEDLNRLWDAEFWTEMFSQVDEWDRLITALNERTGVLNSL